ncbi:MAG: sulfite exporter TauE/SafE family protein [Nitrospirae bacterium]|nr:sulfite exporter TauE/SafE family protein [Nitrospirota bacterium]
MVSLIIGLASGVFGGLVGLGGGVIMIPLMVQFLGLGQHKAHGTSLVALVFTGLAGTFTYARSGSMDVIAAILIAVSAVFTARWGARFANSLPEWKLKRSFGGFLLLVSVIMLLKPYITHGDAAVTGVLKGAVLIITGVFTGFLSGMMGVGGGTIMVPAMVLVLGFGQHLAQGVSLLAMVPAGSVGAYTHWKLGNVQIGLLAGLIPGIIIGTYSGATLARYLQDGTLRVVFAIVLVWTGIKYLRTRKPQAT